MLVLVLVLVRAFKTNKQAKMMKSVKTIDVMQTDKAALKEKDVIPIWAAG